MKSKKMKTILCITGFVLLTLLAIWSQRDIDIEEPEVEVIIIQEEYQMEVLEMLHDIMLLASGSVDSLKGWTNEWEPRAEIAPGVEILYDRLARFAHVYQSEGWQSQIASMEDIISLYNAYDEELDQRLRNLHEWWRYGGKDSENLYIWAIIEALHYYKEWYGGAFNGKESYTEMRIDDMIELEQYLRRNRHFLPDARLRRFL